MQSKKLGRDVKCMVLKFLSDQTICLRIINEKQGSTAGEKLSSVNSVVIFLLRIHKREIYIYLQFIRQIKDLKYWITGW